MPTLRSAEDYYKIYKNAVRSSDTEGAKLNDFSEGSINDMMASAGGLMGSELATIIVESFNKTLIANTSGDDRDELVTDHYGDDFSRLGPQKSVGIVKFSRPNDAAGTVAIAAGTTVETTPDSEGNKQSFVTLSDVNMVGTTVYASIEAVEAGPEGNVESGDINVIADSLSDGSITVTNEDDTSGGSDTQTDAEYLDYVGQLINQLRGATSPSIESKLKSVPGIEKVTVFESYQKVKNWNDSAGSTEGSAYTIVSTTAYIADANGTANDALIDKAEDKVTAEKAAGANITIVAASASSLNWLAEITLNPGGPNYAELSSNTEKIENTMREYIEDLAIGADFDRTAAEIYVLGVWGSDGTNDLSAFETLTPTGDVATADNIKLIPGTISID